MAVYKGIATIIPVVPIRLPPARITIKISSGCDLTLLENING